MNKVGIISDRVVNIGGFALQQSHALCPQLGGDGVGASVPLDCLLATRNRYRTPPNQRGIEKLRRRMSPPIHFELRGVAKFILAKGPEPQAIALARDSLDHHRSHLRRLPSRVLRDIKIAGIEIAPHLLV